MIDTYKARLKAKSTAAGANLSQKRIDALADRLQKSSQTQKTMQNTIQLSKAFMMLPT
jgi:hypothetical protein